jgi:hypothetical protein
MLASIFTPFLLTCSALLLFVHTVELHLLRVATPLSMLTRTCAMQSLIQKSPRQSNTAVGCSVR